MQRSILEIGSEFWLENNQKEVSTYVLSGRTAIDLIIQDIKANRRKTRNVYMPAWCCDSMIQPFIDRGIKILLYDICYKDEALEYELLNDQDIDILYVNNYFGYNNTLSLDVVEHYRSQGAVVIYDRTHALLREDKEYIELSDYHFASIRKWIGIPCGAYLAKTNGSLSMPMLKECPYLDDKKEAMQMKAAYMQGDDSIDKEQFLSLYGKFGRRLSEDYRNYKIDEQSLNIWNYADRQAIKKWRNANATYLQVCLGELKQVKTMFKMASEDCALFVPVLFESKEKRNTVREYLTSHAIYCPIHWPKSSIVDGLLMANDIYDRELSLLCDQRYSFDDMKRIVDTLKGFFEGNY